MAKAPKAAKTQAASADPTALKPGEYLPWPMSPKDLPEQPRTFRIHRIDAFAWQAYVLEDGVELPIGKPDLFDILKGKVNGVMRAEGQAEFLAAKTRAAEAQKSEVTNAK